MIVRVGGPTVNDFTQVSTSSPHPPNVPGCSVINSIYKPY